MPSQFRVVPIVVFGSPNVVPEFPNVVPIVVSGPQAANRKNGFFFLECG